MTGLQRVGVLLGLAVAIVLMAIAMVAASNSNIATCLPGPADQTCGGS